MVYWPIERLTRYKNNTKTHPDTQIEKICNSISDYGFDQPISVDTQGIIIKGHGRLMAAHALGMKEVPVIIREDLTLIEAAASRIADNKVAESPWDEKALSIEMQMLDEEGINIVEATGFTDEEVKAILKNLEFDGGDGGSETDESFDDVDSAHVKMIQLFYDIDKEKTVREICATLGSKFNTSNLSDTVYQALLYVNERFANAG